MQILTSVLSVRGSQFPEGRQGAGTEERYAKQVYSTFAKTHCLTAPLTTKLYTWKTFEGSVAFPAKQHLSQVIGHV